jgi:hypothetical protein
MFSRGARYVSIHNGPNQNPWRGGDNDEARRDQAMVSTPIPRMKRRSERAPPILQDSSYYPTFPDSGWFWSQDCPFGHPGQRNCAPRGGRASKPPVGRAEAVSSTCIKTHLSRRPCRVRPLRPSCRRGRCPQPGDQGQDIREHLTRHRDLGHLEGEVAAVADDLRADLDQLLAQAGQSVVRVFETTGWVK